MSALNFDWTFKKVIAFLTGLIDLKFLDGFQILLHFLFLSQLRVVYSSPSLLLSPFEVSLLFPPSFVV